MVDQPDTAEIRAWCARNDMAYVPVSYAARIEALCDALDAARAEAKCDHGKWRCKWGSEQRTRAEAAEAMAEDFQARFEYAEARIANALAEYRTEGACRMAHDMARALTGDVE